MSAPRVVVCYDEARPGMYLRIEGQDVATFMTSATWRAWLYYPASAVDGTDRDRILLDGGMGLRECQDMLEAWRPTATASRSRWTQASTPS